MNDVSATLGRTALAALLTLTAAPAPAATCSGALLVRYTAQPSLLAGEADTALRLALHAGGCVEVRFPRQDLRHGTHALKPDPDDLSRLESLLDALSIEPAAPPRSVPGARARWHSDPSLITLERFSAGKRTQHDSWLAAPLWEPDKSAGDDSRGTLQRLMHAFAEQAAPTP